MSTDDILKTLRKLRAEIEREYRAEIEGIFGSYARDEQCDDSDLDVLVKFKEKATLYDLVGLGQFLEDTFQCKVDVVSTRALREEIKPHVLRELVAP
jgi:predicted nucleotidyltransferase